MASNPNPVLLGELYRVEPMSHAAGPCCRPCILTSRVYDCKIVDLYATYAKMIEECQRPR